MKKFLSISLTSIILLAAGLCLVIDPGLFMNYVCYIAGGIAIVIAAIKFFSAYKNNTVAKESPLCIILLILGIVLIVLKAQILGVFPLIIGICFLVYGLLKLITAFSLKNTRPDAYKKLLISALIGIGFAIIVIAFSWLAANIIMRIIGILLIYNSLENIFSAIVAKPETENKKKAVKKEAVEAESRDADEEKE